MRDKIIKLWQEGRTYKEIAMVLHCSRNAVAGHIHRHRYPRGSAPQRKVTTEQVDQAVIQANGNRRAAARALGVAESTIRRRMSPAVRAAYPGVLTGATPGPVRAPRADTRAVLERMDEMGVSAYRAAEGAGVGVSTLREWRAGRSKGNRFLVECVRQYLDKYVS